MPPLPGRPSPGRRGRAGLRRPPRAARRSGRSSPRSSAREWRPRSRPTPSSLRPAHWPRTWIDGLLRRGYGGRYRRRPARPRRRANEATELIATRSPHRASVTLEAVRRAPQAGHPEEVLVQEYRVSCASLRLPRPLVEGIRPAGGQDRNPQWAPAALAAVTREDVEALFHPGRSRPDLLEQP